MTSATSFIDEEKLLIPIKPEWKQKEPNLCRYLPWFIRKTDPTKKEYDSVISNFIRKNCSDDLAKFIELHTMPGKLDFYCDKLKTKGYQSLSHEEKIWIGAHVVCKDIDKGKGVLHSKKNLDKLAEAGYPPHKLNGAYGPKEKLAHIINLAETHPDKIPFDVKTRVHFPNGEGDMAQFLRDNILGGAVGKSKASVLLIKIVKKIAPKWLEQLKEYQKNYSTISIKKNRRKEAVKKLLELAKLRPRVGAVKHGGGFNKIQIKGRDCQWFKALYKSDRTAFFQIQKVAPWWFGYNRRELKMPAVCPFDGRHGAKKLDLLDYARDKKNKLYRFGLSKKAKTETDIWMKSIFTYCIKSRVKNGYDKKFHKELITIRPEIEKIYPL
jgi:hypothetical protein